MEDVTFVCYDTAYYSKHRLRTSGDLRIGSEGRNI